MAMTGLDSFDTSVQKSELWLKEIMEELGWDSRDRAYVALRAVLHTLRNRLTINEAAQFGAQLPMVLRGIYYDGWVPAHAPVKDRNRNEFLSHISAYFRLDPDADAEQIARSVFAVIQRHVTAGEIEDVKGMMPRELVDLWE